MLAMEQASEARCRSQLERLRAPLARKDECALIGFFGLRVVAIALGEEIAFAPAQLRLVKSPAPVSHLPERLVKRSRGGFEVPFSIMTFGEQSVRVRQIQMCSGCLPRLGR